MTVAELIEQLKAMPQEALVLVANGETDTHVPLRCVLPGRAKEVGWAHDVYEVATWHPLPVVIIE